MNKFICTGRYTKNPEIRYTNDGTCVARFTLAVDRKFSREEQTADFIPCVSFGKTAEFIEKYMQKGTKICAEGRIQTGSYTKNNGDKVYTTDFVVEQVEFGESKGTGNAEKTEKSVPDADGFMNIPDGIEDMELPFM